MRAAGFKPILAHPERHPQLADLSGILGRLRQQELLFQVDAGSLTGRFGRRARAAAEALFERGWVELVASDAHSLERRPFSLVDAAARIEALAGAREVRRLLAENPRRVIGDEQIVRRLSRPGKKKRPGLLRQLLGSR